MVFIHINTWIAEKDLIEHHYQIKKHSADKDYTHAQKVFEELNLKNLDDYHDLYVFMCIFVKRYIITCRCI